METKPRATLLELFTETDIKLILGLIESRRKYLNSRIETKREKPSLSPARDDGHIYRWQQEIELLKNIESTIVEETT